MKFFKVKKKNAMTIPKSVQDTIPYERVYKNGIIETSTGTFSKSYKIEDMNFRIASQDEQENIFCQFGDMLNSFGSECKFQFTVFNRNIDKDKFNNNILIKSQKDSLNEYREEFNDMLAQKIGEGRNNLIREKYITVSIESESIDEAVTNFARIDGEVASNVKRMNKQDTAPLSLYEYLDLLKAVYDVDSDTPFIQEATIQNETVKSFDFDWMKKMGVSTKDLIGPPSIKIEKDYLEVGDKFVRVMFLDSLPNYLSTDFLSEVVEMPCNMLTSIHFNPLRQDTALKIIKNQMTNINSNVVEHQKRASRSGFSPDLISPELLRSQKEANKLLNDMTSRNQKMFLVTVVLAIYGDSIEELDKHCKSLATIAGRYLCTVKKMNYQQEQGFATALPICNNKVHITRLLTTESGSVFIPFATQELTQENGMYYGLNAVSKNLILFNRLNSKNQNGVILGTPGSGKSFSAKREIVNVLLSTQDEIFVIDPEREYATLAEIFGGEVIRIAAGSKTYINPFDMDLDYADDDDPVTLKSDFIAALCETIVGGHYGLTPVQKSVIDRCVRSMYQPYIQYLHEVNLNRSEKNKISYDRNVSPTMLDFYKLLLAQPQPESQNLALSLELYCTGSLNTFAHKTNVETHSRFTVYDIKDIGSGLKELGLQVCLNDAWCRIISNKKRGLRTWLYIDEFYLLTQTDSSAKFLQQIWKRARKWGGIPTGITQNVEDLLSSKEARAIINNCDFVQMLNLSPLDRNELAAMFNISPVQLSYITNSDFGQGLIYNGKSIIPFVDKFPKDTKLYKAMTTNPDDQKKNLLDDAQVEDETDYMID